MCQKSDMVFTGFCTCETEKLTLRDGQWFTWITDYTHRSINLWPFAWIRYAFHLCSTHLFVRCRRTCYILSALALIKTFILLRFCWNFHSIQSAVVLHTATPLIERYIFMFLSFRTFSFVFFFDSLAVTIKSWF